jgi:hypothetical protein
MPGGESYADSTKAKERSVRFSKWGNRVLLGLGLIAVLATAAFLIYFSRGYGPSPAAVAAMQSSDAVTVSENASLVTLMPRTEPRAGLVFYPGARVEAAAYAARLRPLAEHGYAVFIVKFPLNLAVFGTNRAGEVIAAQPGITKWTVGGHSLGGAFASAFLKDRTDIHGLILYASYPAGDLSRRTDLVAVSIYGTQDALATVERINAAKPTLPPQTKYVAIEGGNHSYFGDYGMQSGDGLPTVPRDVAARQIEEATLEAMEQVAGR